MVMLSGEMDDKVGGVRVVICKGVDEGVMVGLEVDDITSP